MSLPDIPLKAPRRGNRFTRTLGRLGLAASGWKVTGKMPDRSKLVMIVAPHTSNRDFFYGILAVFALGLHANWLGKHTLFRGPAGRLMRWLGGISVDRSRRNDLVEQTAAVFQKRNRLWLAITPEGTRKKVERWKSGFWHIARAAKVPILLVYFDYARREIGFGPLLDPSDDYASDLAQIIAFYQGIVPCHSERF